MLGRGSLCINTGGEKVFPDEVEAALKGHPDVADALVVGLDDERFGQRVVALVQVRPGRVVDGEELRAHGHGLLTGYKVPRQFVFVDEIVRSPSGKPDYPQARSVARAHAATGICIRCTAWPAWTPPSSTSRRPPCTCTWSVCSSWTPATRPRGSRSSG